MGHAVALPRRKPGLLPDLLRAILVEDQTARQTCAAPTSQRSPSGTPTNCAPARSSASGVARCDRVPRPCGDFIAMVTSLPRHSAKVTGFVIAAVAAADDVFDNISRRRAVDFVNFPMDAGRARRRLFVCAMACCIASPTPEVLRGIRV
jgi:hypothetical protein